MNPRLPIIALTFFCSLLSTVAGIITIPLTENSESKENVARALHDSGVITPFDNAVGKLAYRVTDTQLFLDTEGNGTLKEVTSPATAKERIGETEIQTRSGKYKVAFLMPRNGRSNIFPTQSKSGTAENLTVTLTDRNFNGTFFDKNDLILIEEKNAASMIECKLNDPINVNDKFMTVSLSADSQSILLSPYIGETAKVVIRHEIPALKYRIQYYKMQPELSTIYAINDSPTFLLPGYYHIAVIPNVNYQSVLIGFPDSRLLSAGNHLITISRPAVINPDFTLTEETLTLKSVKVTGKNDEIYRIAPLIILKNGDTVIDESQTSYG